MVNRIFNRMGATCDTAVNGQMAVDEVKKRLDRIDDDTRIQQNSYVGLVGEEDLEAKEPSKMYFLPYFHFKQSTSDLSTGLFFFLILNLSLYPNLPSILTRSSAPYHLSSCPFLAFILSSSSGTISSSWILACQWCPDLRHALRSVDWASKVSSSAWVGVCCALWSMMYYDVFLFDLDVHSSQIPLYTLIRSYTQ